MKRLNFYKIKRYKVYGGFCTNCLIPLKVTDIEVKKKTQYEYLICVRCMARYCTIIKDGKIYTKKFIKGE